MNILKQERGRREKRKLAVFLLSSCFLLFAPFAHAQTASELQSKINQRNQDISNLKKEIQNYQKQIDALGNQAASLSATIKTLDLTQKKLAADIKVTENQIDAKNLEITSLGGQITNKQSSIADDGRIIRQALQAVNELDSPTLVQVALAAHSVSEGLHSIDQLANLQNNLVDRINRLRSDKAVLEESKRRTELAREELQALKRQLNDQRAIVLSTTAEKNSLLKETNQSESAYKKILADKQIQQQAYEQEVLNYESQIHLIVNPAFIPHTGTGVLSWPLDSIKVTQYFGNTPFATANPQIYNGKGHTGVDFAASIGTPVRAALSGTVSGVGNTDIVASCYSFGKWVMIKHPNGLSTLYAHLSLQSVAIGQPVSTGQMIGYSGNTGYTTGPHLHFGVYATQGVQITSFANSRTCPGVVIPFATLDAYLNPLSYL